MVISRCAWHPFFCGYPRPLRVVSWGGRGIAFTDTICRSCAARVRIEGLWGSSPPAPVWPGSAQTALLFVGLPLLIALVLMATPLHDATPVAREEAVDALPADPAPSRPVFVAAPVPVSRARPAAMSAPSRVRREPVPAVIFERRRTLRPRREPWRDPQPGLPVAAPARAVAASPRAVAETVAVAATLRAADLRAPQSP